LIQAIEGALGLHSNNTTETPVTYYDCIANPRFFRFLKRIDEDIAREVRAGSCPHCGASLDRADFFRAGDGFPLGTERELLRRFSFCCRRDGCRKRLTPDSLRFLYRKAFVSAVIVLLGVINHGIDGRRAAELAKALKVDRRTIGRWRRWWREDFAQSPLWRTQRGRLVAGGDETLPQTLLGAFASSARTPMRALKNLLALIAPWR
jgi:hypothetical protein